MTMAVIANSCGSSLCSWVTAGCSKALDRQALARVAMRRLARTQGLRENVRWLSPHAPKARSSPTRARVRSGGSLGSPRWSRIFLTRTPSLISAMSLRRSPQCGHSSTSMAKTRSNTRPRQVRKKVRRISANDRLSFLRSAAMVARPFRSRKPNSFKLSRLPSALARVGGRRVV